jgi:hypothetical protein
MTEKITNRFAFAADEGILVWWDDGITESCIRPEKFSVSVAEGKVLFEMESRYGRNHIHFITSLENARGISREINDAIDRYDRARQAKE